MKPVADCTKQVVFVAEVSVDGGGIDAKVGAESSEGERIDSVSFDELQTAVDDS